MERAASVSRRRTLASLVVVPAGPSMSDPLLEQAAAHRRSHGRCTVRHAELLVEALEVGLDGGRAEVELAGDVRRGVAVGSELEDLALARGEHGAGRGLPHPDLGCEAGLD